MLLIEILGTNGANEPTTRTFPAKGDRPSRTIFEQKAYAHFGGLFPVEIKLSFDELSKQYPLGKYELAKSSFKVNQYGQLQLDPYSIELVPTSDFGDKK